ncbi:MAG TPA: glycosyltransferase family 2 protein [Verrucomicrobiae bacterium]|nr:glycosyltransferase family 2 protein [Verrucomicrobiae bacterium]
MGAAGAPLLSAIAADNPGAASSAFRRESTGLWLVVDGVRMPAFGGVVYQHTEGDKHIREYSNSLHEVYQALNDEDAGGQGHGARLAQLGVRAIRVYELPVANEEDAARTKEIFRRLYSQHGIKVLIGDWAGLNTGMDFKNPADLAALRAHIQKLVATYADEPWVLGWQLGNENNYHIDHGILGQEIGLDAAGYYALMDELAGQVKDRLRKKNLTQFVSLGQGDLTTNEAGRIAAMTNIDAVGINCYRENPAAFEEIILTAAGQLRLPIYFAEIGRPGENSTTEEQQSQYLQQILVMVFSHAAGRARTGVVIGAFVHEATDEAWKRFERGKEGDAHYGILGKPSEAALGRLLKQNNDFFSWISPTNDTPENLITAAWQCLDGPYVSKYSRDYGYAMTYANRAITLYQDTARAQQLQLLNRKAPRDSAANTNFWALNTVGTGYFIIGECWMMLSYDFKGAQPATDAWQRFLEAADVPQKQSLAAGVGPIIPTNAAACMQYSRKIFNSLAADFPYAQLQDRDGKFHRLDRVVQATFPELSRPYLPWSWLSDLIFTVVCVGITLGLAGLSRQVAARALPVKTEPVMSSSYRCLFVLALAFNFACLYWFLSWWCHPVRARYYTVQPGLYVFLSIAGGIGMLFYLYVWHLFWNMRRPAPMKAPAGLRVAVVTTRVASEPIDSLQGTLKKMNGISYPHDSYLLDEENSDKARDCCQTWNIIHFSRKGNPKYNEPHGKFQARTKGGNLNSWLYEYGGNYDIVAFLDPDHAPRPDFLDKVLGYFRRPEVAFVQGPQVFHNRSANWIAQGAAEQSYFFYGPIQMGLFGIGACVVNGSHSTFRVTDLMALKGQCYAVHDADDILTSIRIHALGKTGVYVPDIIAEGLAPDTWDEFSKQQRRWAYSMFNLLFYFYIPELVAVPWRCKLAYLLFALFYLRSVAFVGLLLMPFISVLTGNPPVNANITGFCLRYLPFFALNYGILLMIGQRFLIPEGSRRGFWYRAGILWVAMWWDLLCAMVKAARTRRVKDRLVCAKWPSRSSSSWRGVQPHLVLMTAGIAAIIWICRIPGRLDTVWGTLPFLGLIVLSQAIIAFKILRTTGKVPQPAASPLKPVESSLQTLNPQ